MYLEERATVPEIKVCNIFFNLIFLRISVIGTIAPPVRNDAGQDNTDVRRYFPWLPSWLDVNVVVPVGATVVVIIVGIVVICVALSRRTRGPEQTRLRGISSADEKYYEGQCIKNFFFTIFILMICRVVGKVN